MRPPARLFRRRPTRRHRAMRLLAEALEPRALLATFTVTNLLNAGAGSLRAAITQANANAGADEITFAVAGTVPLSTALPAVTDTVSIKGSTAPGFVGTPRITVNFRGQAGLQFAPGSNGSSLTNLALVQARGAGVTLDASGITLAGNSIGVLSNGTTAAPNTGAGVLVTARGSGNRIGRATTIAYNVTSSVPAAAGGTLPVAGWQGLTTAGSPGQYFITGTTENPNDTSQTAGLLYAGPITAQGGAGYVMVMPNQPGHTTDGTTSYSADNLGGGRLRIVGTYSNTGAANELGFLFNGTVNDVGTAANYEPIPRPHPSATWNVPHSTSGGLVVGNYDSSTSGDVPAGGGLAYVYDAVNRRYLVPSMVYPGSASNTAYGIWWNGGTSYTICGGFANSPINNLLNPRVPLSQALLVDFDSASGRFSNWKSFTYTSPTTGASGITHFEGISGVEPGTYTLAATAATEAGTIAGFVTVRRNADGSFGDMLWTDVTPPVVGGSAFADSVYGNAVVGIDPSNTGVNTYQATITPGGNLISGNQGTGIVVAGNDNVIASNTIGLTVAGNVALPNGGDGVRLMPGASGNLIGRADPVSGIAYDNTAATGVTVTGWQGLRAAATAGDYLFAGTSDDYALLSIGPINASANTDYKFLYPNSQTTSAYGPDLLSNGDVRIVGTYVNKNSSTRYGFVYGGPATDVGFANVSNYRTIRPASNPEFTYVHSTMGGLAVGNYDSATQGGLPVGPGKAFIYNTNSNTFPTDISFPGAASTTAYGIWSNGGTNYTICGGYSIDPINNLASAADQNRAIGRGYLVDYDSASNRFSNWKPFTYPNGPANVEFVTHFEGISSVEAGVYTLAATSGQAGQTTGLIGSFVTVRRNANGSFGNGEWVDVAYPGATASLMTSVYGNAMTGIAVDSSGSTPFQATIATAFQLSNVIGGNGGNGIAIFGASNNRVMMNNVGTSFSGSAAVPNRGSGIVVSNAASGTVIGGQATGGNAPTAGVFVRPPQGNLISGNSGNGVLVTCGASGTSLSGNFVGTTASGNAALANGGDGVAVVGARGTSLLGTTFRQSPFVFYNVLSGNTGNGLRITNSTDTTVQANFTGTGADNATVVANGGDGILVNGASSGILVGGPIPLGNVNSGNNRYGIEVVDKATGFVAFNSFVGMVAFGGAAPNRLDGMRITSTGGNNVIRTCLVAGNFGNGIVLGGNARGVTIEDTAAGTNSAISAAIPNYGSGILITDNAYGNVIGGFQPSIETKVHLSGNVRYGIEVTGKASNNRIFNAVIGGGFVADDPIPNGLGGIYLGPSTSGTVIGGTQPFMANRVLSNRGNGLTIAGAWGNRIIGNEIRSNLGDGIAMVGGQSNMIGTGTAGNTILSNGLNGISVQGNSKGSTIVGNSIMASGQNGILLNAATDLLVGGLASGDANEIVTSVSYGLLAVGPCSRTRVIRNAIAGNTAGNVNLASSTGITYVP